MAAPGSQGTLHHGDPGSAPSPIPTHPARTPDWAGSQYVYRPRRPTTTPAAATMILGALQFRAFMAHITGHAPSGSSDDGYVEALADLLTHGLAPEEGQ